ncbi:sensor histidine kinase [Streptomyces xanthochromogenes]|uniref:sensor histidine kinase n=1 Tax=Streptomyces xanthochromogenes TaxID=67384 RepID=UPI00136F8B01|nr:sensor histidine kinase [Streptomyces sp. SID1034]MYV95638.1 sensor histidine kinase [Streptomyces sp. SID1034]
MVGGIRGWYQRHWGDLSRVEKVEKQSRLIWLCTTWFFYLSWEVPFVLLELPHARLPLALALATLATGAAQAHQGIRAHRGALDQYLGRGPLPRRPVLVSLALCLLSLVLLGGLYAAHGLKEAELVMVVLYIVMPFGMTYSTLLKPWTFLRRFALLGLATAAVFAAFGVRGERLVYLALVVALSGIYILLMARCGAWTLAVMWESDRARETEARLAVAEERLRFGRDMHDVLGRNLAVIALKAELAVQLAQRGRPEAVAQMVEVQRIAQESQKEVREVVRGYREADLGVEIEGARGVLEAAGIGCAYSGPAEGLTVEAQSALGWVVREATTNVLRHGDARSVAIRLAVAEHTATLVVENDGVPERPNTTPGSGLAGLRERLSALGGTLEAGPAGDGLFRLTAQVPR